MYFFHFHLFIATSVRKQSRPWSDTAGYKNIQWLWGSHWKFRHESNCSASRGLPSDAEHPEWRNFQFETNNHYRFFFLHTRLSTIAFRLEHMLFYQFYDKITTFFRPRHVRIGFLPYTLTSKCLAEADVKMMSRRQKVKFVILTSCTRVALHPLV